MSAQHTQLVMTEAFQRELSWGMWGIFGGNLHVGQSKESVVELIQNLVDFAPEGHFTEERLRQDVAIAVSSVPLISAKIG